MTNKLIFVDMPASDPEAMQAFYEQLFGWQINPRPKGEFHQIVPGDGLHLGIFNAESRPPDPAPGTIWWNSPFGRGLICHPNNCS